MTRVQLTALFHVLQYLEEDESKDFYTVHGNTEDHIYHAMFILRGYLNGQEKKQKQKDEEEHWKDQPDGKWHSGLDKYYPDDGCFYCQAGCVKCGRPWH